MADSSVLHLAVKAGDLDKVLRLLRQGYDIGQVNPAEGLNSLHLAVLMGNFDIIELLSRDDEHINSSCSLLGSNWDGYTPLHFSVDVCNESVTQLFLSRNVNINSQNKHGNTALHVAARNGYISEIDYRYILTNNNIYFGDNYSEDIINRIRGMCIINEYSYIVDILLQSGANAQIVNGYNETALHIACQESSNYAVELLLKNCGSIINYKDINMRTALHVAAGNPGITIDIIKTLIKYGADINSTDSSNCTPLYYARLNHNIDVVRVLVESGCDNNIADNNIADNNIADNNIADNNIADNERSIDIVINYSDEIIHELLLHNGADISCSNWSASLHSSFHSPLISHVYGIKLLEYCCNIFFKKNVEIFGGYKSHLCLSQYVSIYFEAFKSLLHNGAFKNINRNINLNNGIKIPTFFVNYAIKVKVLGCYFARNYPDINATKIILLPEEKVFEEDCKKVVKIMKRKLVCSSGVSLHEFLKKDLNKMVRCLKNKEVVNSLNAESKLSTSIYSDLVKAFFNLGMERRTMLDRCYECFNMIFCRFPRLPDIVVENIFDRLTTDDLKKFTC